MEPARKRTRDSIPNGNQNLVELSEMSGETSSTMTAHQATETEKESYILKFPVMEKVFTIEHKFEKLSSWSTNDSSYSETHFYYGVTWGFAMRRETSNHLGLYLCCSNKSIENEWSIATKYTFIIHGTSLGRYSKRSKRIFTKVNSVISWGPPKVMKWEKLLEESRNDAITVSVEVKVLKVTDVVPSMSNRFKKNARKADLHLIVGGEDFYVKKKKLAKKSTYFHEMFFPTNGGFLESDQHTISLPGVDPTDFQPFLEVIHSMQPLNNYNMEGVLLLAESFKSSYVLNYCENCLLNESFMPLAKTFQVATKYKLDRLTTKCISEMSTVANVRAAYKMSENAPKALMDKLWELYDKENGGTVRNPNAIP